MDAELWRQAGDIIVAALELEGSERERYLEQETTGKPELLAEVRQHLESYEKVGSVFLAEPLLQRSSSNAPGGLIGRQIGPYALKKLIGYGGMGEVYLADRIDGELDRQVAIKVLGVGLDSRAKVLFAEERKILAALEHPSIARLYDAGHSPEGLPYLVMEYVEGRAIDDFCQVQNIDLDQRLELFTKVCRAVDFAHKKLVLHSDLKPANILVQSSCEPKLLDFGISRWIRGERSGTLEQTEIGDSEVRAFTPAYASPEQIDPRLLGGQSLGVGSDIYSLGRILRQLTTDRDIHGVGSLAPDLEAIFDRATHEAPDKRYSSAEQLAEEIDRFRGGYPVLTREPTLAYLSARFVGRHRVAAAIGALIAFWIFVSLVMLTSQRARIARQRDEAMVLAAEAQKERQAVLRLADIRRLRDLEAEAEKLWPIHPDRIPAMNAWLKSAEELVQRRDSHAAALNSMTERIEKIASSSDRTTKESLSQLDWQQEILNSLVERLDAWIDPSLGLIAEVRRRFEKATSLEFRSFESYRHRWQRTQQALADPKLYPPYKGLALTAQVGLVPLGPDPGSGLLELAVLDTGTLPERDPHTKKLILNDDFAIVLVLIPAGRFVMGSQQEDPADPNYDPSAQLGRDFLQSPQVVEVELFLLSKFEITQAQWASITNGKWPSRYNAQTHVNEEGEQPSQRHPVEQVSWKDADLWLRRFGLRLPSEAQWEYAARAGTTSPWWTGTHVESLAGAANIADRHLRDHGGSPEWRYTDSINDGFGRHAPVGRFRSNGFGLHDVHGNVWEWCDGSPEVYATYRSEPDVRTARGGSWWYTGPHAKVTYRIFGTELSAIGDLGLRAARHLDPGLPATYPKP